MNLLLKTDFGKWLTALFGIFLTFCIYICIYIHTHIDICKSWDLTAALFGIFLDFCIYIYIHTHIDIYKSWDLTTATNKKQAPHQTPALIQHLSWHSHQAK